MSGRASHALLERRARVMADRTEQELLRLADSSEMVAYIQQALPERLPHLGEITLDCVYLAKRGVHLVYVLGRCPGMPMVFRSPCLRSCLVGCARHLCLLAPPQPGEVRPLQGIAPLDLPPLPVFQRGCR